MRSVFVESALPGPRCPWFPGHSFIRSRGMAGVVAVPKVTVPGPGHELFLQPFLQSASKGFLDMSTG